MQFMKWSLWKCQCGLVLAASLTGCGTMGSLADSGNADQSSGTDGNASAAKRSYASPGGTSDLNLGSADNGAATLKSFDPGAFVRTAKVKDSSGNDVLNPAQFDGGSPPPPPPPPPPPSDGGAPPPPPSNDGGVPPPPADGSAPPPDMGPQPGFDPNNPPPDGSAPGFDPNNPPPDGSVPGFDPNNPPPDGSAPGFDPNNPPPDGSVPGFDPNNPPPDGSAPGFDPNNPPPEGFPPGFDPNNPPPDGSAPGFDPNNPPPGGFPPDFDPNNPPPEGFPPFPDGSFPPPPPPSGFEAFPGDLNFSGDFGAFLDNQDFADNGVGNAPPTFEQFPFDVFLEDHSLNEIIPDIPPEFMHGEFGDFQFGDVPPPPAGFPPFPPPPDFIGDSGDFGSFFGPPPGVPPQPPGEFVGGGPPGPPFGPPIGPPPDLPPEFFQFDQRLGDIDSFLADFEFPPPLPPGAGPDGPQGSGGFFVPPEQGSPGEGTFVPALAAVDFEQVADLLPDGFLPPEEVVQTFETFGQDHPLIGEGGVVNPTLEKAAFDHPPVPENFDGFDFSGDTPQFDDLFTVYSDADVGTTKRGQVNTTLTQKMDDGTEVRCSDTTVVEAVQGQSTPIIQMEPGVFQTQWVVNIRRLTNSVVEVTNPDDPTISETIQQSKETLSQMTWTMLMKEVDTTGDGVPNEMRISGTNLVTMLSETTDGDPPPILGELAPTPPLLLPFQFEGVLNLGGTP